MCVLKYYRSYLHCPCIIVNTVLPFLSYQTVRGIKWRNFGEPCGALGAVGGTLGVNLGGTLGSLVQPWVPLGTIGETFLLSSRPILAIQNQATQLCKQVFVFIQLPGLTVQ
jgi:hypothetical protein